MVRSEGLDVGWVINLCAIYALKSIIITYISVFQYLVYLIYMPVTQGVAGSSPVQTASFESL